ncbi:NAD-dependent epimerase/dehydratase family protein [Ideonella sp. A 288]|uniref:NAD-dependent epimerase/dehydratase family protein n=1 Tax=Ideonella sp. A 288 TaxID=1962181 RepID=UPI0018FE7AE8|nr:NAD-dependent epimerase/dehydratase family protein [Ideonella sp. A 288]
MKLLVVGGTQFVGRHLVDAALARGDEVTLFNRGRTAAALPAGVQWRAGDRRGDLSALAEGRWDAVVDTCGYLPSEVARMADALDGRIGCYAFVSSVSAYASATRPNDEQAPLGRIDDEDTEVVDGRTYGPLKAACERVLQARLGGRALCIRPGLVVGPHDPTQRFTWWPARLARAALDGAPVLAPGEPSRPIQFIDARDLAAFVLRALDDGLRGAFNAVAPPGFTTMGALLQACAAAAGASAPIAWAHADVLAREGVRPWVEMPLWLPADGEHGAFMDVDSTKALSAGLRLRPLAETVVDTLAWWRTLPPAQQVFDKAGLSPEREVEVLARCASAVSASGAPPAGQSANS